MLGPLGCMSGSPAGVGGSCAEVHGLFLWRAGELTGVRMGAGMMGGRGRGRHRSNRSGGGRHGPAGRMPMGPSRGEQSDYCQHFVDTGQRPQNFLRDAHLVRLINPLDQLIRERRARQHETSAVLLQDSLQALFWLGLFENADMLTGLRTSLSVVPPAFFPACKEIFLGQTPAAAVCSIGKLLLCGQSVRQI